MLNHVQIFATPWTVAHKAPLSTEFSRQEVWSGLSFTTPEDLPDPEIKPALTGGFFTTAPPGKPCGTLNSLPSRTALKSKACGLL